MLSNAENYSSDAQMAICVSLYSAVEWIRVLLNEFCAAASTESADSEQELEACVCLLSRLVVRMNQMLVLQGNIHGLL